MYHIETFEDTEYSVKCAKVFTYTNKTSNIILTEEIDCYNHIQKLQEAKIMLRHHRTPYAVSYTHLDVYKRQV